MRINKSYTATIVLSVILLSGCAETNEQSSSPTNTNNKNASTGMVYVPGYGYQPANSNLAQGVQQQFNSITEQAKKDAAESHQQY
jgi:PBP1b-binding outer membrane lipoprotein LpoB